MGIGRGEPCQEYFKVPVGTLCQTQHRINADVVMELIKELLKAIAEYYSQLNREEFLETVKKGTDFTAVQ